MVVTKPALPAICAAMPDEAALISAVAKPLGEPTKVGGATFQRIDIANTPALLVTSGIGLTNAAAAATIAVTQFGADLLISAGSAGGMGTDVKVGDIVIGTETKYTFADATAFGKYELGQVPQMPPSYLADPQLITAVAQRSQPAPRSQATPSPHADSGSSASIPASPGNLTTHQGLIISSDAFITANNFNSVADNFPTALAADMETAAIAQVAYLFGVPWLAVRGISDLCGPAAADDFVTHLDDAAALSAQAIVAMFS